MLLDTQVYDVVAEHILPMCMALGLIQRTTKKKMLLHANRWNLDVTGIEY